MMWPTRPISRSIASIAVGVENLSEVKTYIDKAESVLFLNDIQPFCGAEEGRTYDLGICSGLLEHHTVLESTEILQVVREHCRSAIFEIKDAGGQQHYWIGFVKASMPACVVIILDEGPEHITFRIVQYPQSLAYIEDIHFLWEHPDIHKSHTLSFHMQMAYDLGREGWSPTYQKEREFQKVFNEIRENGMDVPLYAQYADYDLRYYVARGNRALACAKALVRIEEWAPRAQVPIRAILATDPLCSDTPAVRLYHG